MSLQQLEKHVAKKIAIQKIRLSLKNINNNHFFKTKYLIHTYQFNTIKYLSKKILILSIGTVLINNKVRNNNDRFKKVYINQLFYIH